MQKNHTHILQNIFPKVHFCLVLKKRWRLYSRDEVKLLQQGWSNSKRKEQIWKRQTFIFCLEKTKTLKVVNTISTKDCVAFFCFLPFSFIVNPLIDWAASLIRTVTGKTKRLFWRILIIIKTTLGRTFEKGCYSRQLKSKKLADQKRGKRPLYCAQVERCILLPPKTDHKYAIIQQFRMGEILTKGSDTKTLFVCRIRHLRRWNHG